MANDVKFEGKERRMAKIEKCLAEYGLSSLEEARDLCLSKGIDVNAIVKGVQPIAFENAGWAYTLGAAVAIKSNVKTASEAAEKIGVPCIWWDNGTKCSPSEGEGFGLLDRRNMKWWYDSIVDTLIDAAK